MFGSAGVAGFVQRKVGARWDRNARQLPPRRRWYNSDKLQGYVLGCISPETGRGVPGALERALVGRVLGTGLSIGAGNGRKEIALVQAGLVEHFTLYELSTELGERARRGIAEAGLDERMTVHIADAFAATHPPYDLVYWDHALHHMLDVAAAVRWSVAALAPGGLLVINDYVGPTRLQWTREQVALARAYMREAAPLLRSEPHVPQRTLLHRWKLMLRDPSEAPQSDRILSSCRAACDGWAPTPIGCALISICGVHVVPLADEDNPALDLLIDWDRRAKAEGHSHFAFGIWRKPG
jgi:SAM-dependent methyltransferase